MDAARIELLRHLFALATEIAEAAHEAATSGQDHDLTPRHAAETATALRGHGADLRATGDTILAAIRNEGPDEKPDTAP